MKRFFITAFICLSAAGASYAQGLPGSELPKEVFGRTERTDKEIAALNNEVDRRRLLLAAGLIVPITIITYKLTSKKKKTS
jgi:hypothetical protein